MDCNRILLILLYALGLVLPVLGAALAYGKARAALREYQAKAKREREIKAKWDADLALAEALPDPDERRDAENRVQASYDGRFSREGLEAPTYDLIDSNATGIATLSRALHEVSKGNGWNAALIVIGLFASTAASIWVLFIPPA